MMIGKMAIQITIQTCDLTSQLFKRIFCHQRGCSISTINDHPETITQQRCKAFLKKCQIIGNNLALHDPTLSRDKVFAFKNFSQLLNVRSKQGFLSHTHLEAIVFCGVMTTGNHYAAINLTMKQGKIQ